MPTEPSFPATTDGAGEIAIVVHGLKIRIWVGRKDLFDSVFDLLPHSWSLSHSVDADRKYAITESPRANDHEPPGAENQWTLIRDGEPIFAASDPAIVLRHFETDLELYVAVHAQDRVFVHAGVVGWQGRAILVPGMSFSGKTTLVRSLIQQGAEYYSDESAIIDPDGAVYPSPKPLFVRESETVRTKYSAETLGAKTGLSKLRVGLVVVTEYCRDAIWRPRTMSRGEAVLALLANTPCARHRPQAAFRSFGNALVNARTLAGVRGDADAVARDLLQIPMPLA